MILDLPDKKIDYSDTQSSLKYLHKYTKALRDELEFVLLNLDEDNMNDSFMELLESLKGAVVITGGLITETIYADYGDIAELTVDRVSTSKKVPKYKISDVTDDNYILIQDKTIKFITATVKEGYPTKQHVNRYGESLYWQDADQKAMGTTVTSDPVYIYDYDELVKLQISFEMDEITGQYVPKVVFGAGVGIGNYGKGFIYKGVDGFYLDYYSSTNGALRRILLGDLGLILTPYDLVSMDFYNNGFSAKYSGETVSMTWEKDGSGRITSLITEDNVTIPVTWHAGDM